MWLIQAFRAAASAARRSLEFIGSLPARAIEFLFSSSSSEEEVEVTQMELEEFESLGGQGFFATYEEALEYSSLIPVPTIVAQIGDWFGVVVDYEEPEFVIVAESD